MIAKKSEIHKSRITKLGLVTLIVVSLLLAILLAGALNSFTRVTDSVLADTAPTATYGKGGSETRPYSAPGKNYLPIIFLNSATAGGAWLLSGNAGTVDGTDFLGTTDDISLTLRVKNVVGWRLAPTNRTPNVIGGYSGNNVAPGVFAATIGGGGGNVDALNNSCSTCYNSVNAKYGTVGGGFANNIPVTGTQATIGGGSYNTAGGSETTVGGGLGNNASGYIATVGGGVDNTASGYEATVPGGNSNTAGGTYSFAAGQRAKALHNGSFVWADSSPFDFTSSTTNSFKVRATNGIRMVVQIDGSGNPTVSCLLNSSTVSWSCSSDRNVKENFTAVDRGAILDKLSALPITQWNIIGTDPGIKHVGPMAQDFYAAFGLGNDDTTIGTVDAQGIAFAAIQGLAQENDELKTQNAAQQKQIDTLDARLTALEQSTGTRNGLPSSRDALGAAIGAVVVAGIVVIGRRQRA